MSFIGRIRDRLAGRQETETRRGELGWGAVGFGLGPIVAGNYVNASIAENLSTVVSCVNAIGSGAGALPAYVYRRQGAGRIELPDHPVSAVIRQPNARQTWPDFVEMLVGSTLLHGNGLAIIEADAAGRVTGFVPVPWQFVLPQLLPSGRLAFDVTQVVMPWGGTGVPRRYFADEVIHLKDRSDDGYLGRSRLSRAHEVLDAALSLQGYTGAMWRNGSVPSGVLTTDQKFSNKEARDNLRATWEDAHAGVHNARKTVILEQGLKYESIAVSPEDAEVLASRRFTVEELCRLFQVPPPIIQDYSHNTFVNSAQAARWFASLTLLPWVRKIEAEFSLKVFGDPALHLEIDMSGMMRGDYEARWASYAIARDKDILSADEIREIEGFNPRGDRAADPALGLA